MLANVRSFQMTLDPSYRTLVQIQESDEGKRESVYVAGGGEHMSVWAWKKLFMRCVSIHVHACRGQRLTSLLF